MKKLTVSFIIILVSSILFAEKISFSADSMSGSNNKDNASTVLNGNARIETESLEISADKIELSGKEYRYIKAWGHVTGHNKETKMDFFADSLEYDRNTKLASLSGNVSLVDLENEVTAAAQMIEYNSDSETAVMQIEITLNQKDNVCNGSYAVYSKKEQLLDLYGNAKIKQGEDTFRAQHITLNMDTQEITLDGRVKGTVTDKEEAKEEPAEDTNEADEKKEASEKTIEETDHGKS